MGMMVIFKLDQIYEFHRDGSCGISCDYMAVVLFCSEDSERTKPHLIVGLYIQALEQSLHDSKAECWRNL